MSLVLAGFCVVNCWAIPKLWWPARMLSCPVLSTPPGGGRVVRMRPAARPAFRPAAPSAWLLAA
jgi:hypothetical protein